MKTALILYVLTMTAPDGESYVLDSHLTLEDCGTAGQIVPVPERAAYSCEVM